jgi:hypothetical protein
MTANSERGIFGILRSISETIAHRSEYRAAFYDVDRGAWSKTSARATFNCNLFTSARRYISHVAVI